MMFLPASPWLAGHRSLRPFGKLISLPAFRQLAVCAFLLLAGATAWGQATESAEDNSPPPRWWKGNLHTHSFWSDGNDFPEMIAKWYRDEGYHFLALTDHNVLSEGQRWMRSEDIVQRGGPDVVDKYLDAFGDTWVETRGSTDTSSFQVRLKPLNEFRALVEERQRFLLLQAEEISDRAEGKPIHLNASNLRELVRPVGGTTVRETIANNVRAVQEQAERTDRPLLVHVNHPNFGWAMTAEDLAYVTAERFFEVYNGHPAVNHLGDDERPSVERMWDIANTIRLGQLRAAPLYGIATDDSHNYHDTTGAISGRGWVMVKSRWLTPEFLIDALQRGDFYASSGVELEGIEFDEEASELRVEVKPAKDATYRIEFIGTRASEAAAVDPQNAAIGRVLKTVEGSSAIYRLTGEELYVRAVIHSSLPHEKPTFDGQVQQAWTQPVGWQKWLSE